MKASLEHHSNESHSRLWGRGQGAAVRALVALVALVAFVLSTLALPGAALAASKWWHQVPLNVDVHEHAFHKATANDVDCVVRYRLYFVAPPKQYGDDRNEVRNHYRMRAQVKLGNHVVLSPEFINSAPGRRVYAFSQDTSAEGCWAKEKQKLWQVNVHACRGSRCRVKPFE
jgi:hypothetical protein